MPVIYVCRNCGHVLFTFRRGQDSYGVRTPSEIRDQLGGKCPRCGHGLGIPDLKDIEIKPRRAVPEAWRKWIPRPA